MACHVIDLSEKGQQYESVSYSCCTPDGKHRQGERQVIIEHNINVYVNECLTMRLVCSKDNLPYLIIGRLVSEGIIKTADDIELIKICEKGYEARVILKGNEPLVRSVDESLSCCSDNKVFYRGRNEQLEKLRPVEPDIERVFSAIDCLTKDMEVHKRTGGTHSAFLFLDNNMVFSCEDIGRHNAVDKAVGYMKQQGIKEQDCLIFTTGRVPVDMARKVIAAGIPVLVSKAVPTLDAINMAKEYGLKLICRAWPDSFEEYT